ncbi:Dabb family protein [Halonatronum saccharophilum]|uniref:Dabb family protein n=1 Tax=Halonatronum saccharophilum TaxID=150060 RepID=UPI0004889CB3|nr:Dabb family protein [Halonatronum saccharophilum]
MVKHIVMWRLKEDRKEAGKKVKEILEGLKDKIEDIKAIEVGLDFNRSKSAYDIVLYSEFEDQGALARYQKHPEHLKAAEFVREVVKERAVVDYK